MPKEFIEVLKFLGTGLLGTLTVAFSVSLYFYLYESFPGEWWAEIARAIVLSVYAFPTGRKLISFFK